MHEQLDSTARESSFLLTTVNVLHLADGSTLVLEARSAAGGRRVGSHDEASELGEIWRV